ncbi:MAG: CRTAC1 family protein [Steroidobacteraceae bacterium]
MNLFAPNYRHVVVALLVGTLGVVSQAAEHSPVRFVNEASIRGVADPAVNSTGPTFGDYDLDGDLDIFVPVEDLAPGLHDRLFENQGDGRFVDVSTLRGVDNPGSFSRGAVFCDLDNDGDADLVSATMPPGQSRQRHIPTTLFRNLLREQGEPNFIDVTRESGLMRAGNAEDEKIGGMGDTAGGVGCADYDRDGDLDIFWKNADGEIENALFRNEGNWQFLDVTNTSGVAVQEKLKDSNAQGSPNWVDFDQDGWPDLLITNEGDRKLLLRNLGDGRFEDITLARRAPNALPLLNPGYAQGACIADFDHDGDMDIFLPMADQASRLLLNQLKEKGALSFDDATIRSGAGVIGGARGCVAADFDNDGHVDLYLNNGGPSNTLINDVIAGFPPFVQFYIAWEKAPNVLLRNLGQAQFVDVTDGSGAEGLGIGSGVGAADLNGDGFVDLYVTNRTYYAMGQQVSPEAGESQLLMNQGNDHRWLRVQLVGTRSNRDAMGARVSVVAGGFTQTQEKQSAHGYNSTNDPVLNFGLGAHDVDEVRILWPSGQEQVVTKPESNQTLVVTEPTKEPGG